MSEDLKTIAVGNFPAKLWRHFVGACRCLNVTVPEQLADILRNWLKEQHEKGKV